MAHFIRLSLALSPSFHSKDLYRLFSARVFIQTDFEIASMFRLHRYNPGRRNSVCHSACIKGSKTRSLQEILFGRHRIREKESAYRQDIIVVLLAVKRVMNTHILIARDLTRNINDSTHIKHCASHYLLFQIYAEY